MKLFKTIISGLLAACCISVMSVASLAANEDFNFYLCNTGSEYIACTEHSNLKIYANDDATVKTTYNNAPGWGFAICMMYRYYFSGEYYWNIDTITSPGMWISGLDTKHPHYTNGNNAVNRPHYVGARIDNDYYGPYSCEGVFNADYTNP